MEIDSVPFKVSFPGEDDGVPVDPRLGEPYRMIKYGALIDIFKWHGKIEDETLPESIELIQESNEEEEIQKEKERKLKAKAGGNSYQFKITRLNPVSKEKLAEMKSRFTAYSNSKECHKKRDAELEGLKKHIMHWAENEEEIYRQRDIACAKAALEYYNKKHGTDYEIVETLGSYTGVVHGFLYHCNFRARPVTVNHGTHPPSPQLFFAELLHHINADSVQTCVICHDPALGRPGGCTMCRDQLWHPDSIKRN